MEFKFVFRKLWLSTLSVAGGESFSLTRARCTAETSWLPGTVCFWYPAIRDLSSVLSCTLTYDTSVTVYRIPGQHGHVYLVGLYIFFMYLSSSLICSLCSVLLLQPKVGLCLVHSMIKNEHTGSVKPAILFFYLAIFCFLSDWDLISFHSCKFILMKLSQKGITSLSSCKQQQHLLH